MAKNVANQLFELFKIRVASDRAHFCSSSMKF